MTIRTKLLAGFAGVFLPIALLCVVAITQLGASNGRLRTLYQARLVPTVQLSQIVDNLDQMRQIVTQYALTTKGEESATVLRDGVLLEIDTLDTSITHAVDRYRAGMSDPDQQALLQRWPTAWDKPPDALEPLRRDTSPAKRGGHRAHEHLQRPLEHAA